MNITLGCKCWSGGAQYGFRIYAADIRALVLYLVYPSADGQWRSLGDFYQELVAGHIPTAYSRSLSMSDGARTIEVTATIAKHGRSVQGYITAPLHSWLRDFVEDRLYQDLECEYLVQSSSDYVLLPAHAKSVKGVLDGIEKTARQSAQSRLRQMGYGPPPNADEIGLYFEDLEYRRLLVEFPSPQWRVYHRHPLIDSTIPFLRTNDVSCDIDVVMSDGNVARCVEVKSVSGAPGSRFALSRRERESRLWCNTSRIPYQIVVYYHVRCQVIERRVIEPSENMNEDPIGYWCYPP